MWIWVSYHGVSADNNLYKKVSRFGLNKKFYFENGGRDYLLKNNGLDFKKIFLKLQNSI